ncbi:MAG: type IV secretion system protein [Acidaminococcaceae bacterium]|jgi:type IV secretion system protein VirB5|nr:type IV secretion system protein [Acidaminococcaceae bacterium]
MDNSYDKKYEPEGSPQDYFDRGAIGPYQSMIVNVRDQLDKSQQRNKIYLIIIIVLIVALVYICMTAKFKTYVVRVNDTTGEVSQGIELRAKEYSPKDAEMRHFLAEFTKKIRTVPLDPVLMRANWNTAQNFMTREAAQKLSVLVEREGHISKLGKFTVTPDIKTIQLQPGTERTYQVRWVEEDFAMSGQSSGQVSSYVALYTVVVQPPEKEEELLVNPLGIRIADLSYARETEVSKE